MTKAGKLPRNTLIAMIIFIAALSGGLYFFFVDRPVRTGIREADEERTGIESRLSLLKARAENVSGVSDEVGNLAASGQQSWMPSYNSEEAELDMLHTLLDSRTSDYQLSFENVTRDGNQIRRGCSLSFTTDSYQTAKDIIYRLNHGQFRCLISSTSSRRARRRRACTSACRRCSTRRWSAASRIWGLPRATEARPSTLWRLACH